MKQEEKQLFKSLCDFISDTVDEDLLPHATPSVLGHLFYNRMGAIAYGSLKEQGLLGRVNREFRNSLKVIYEYNVRKNQSYYQCIAYLKNILSEVSCNYAMLKGALLCRYYPKGYRTSNDIDLLVLPEDVTTIGDVLYAEGFRQGNIRDGKFMPATRREIIESKMMRGETVPYIKEVGLPNMKFLEVDINFSLDFKNGDTKTLREMLSRVTDTNIHGMNIKTLELKDFFIHLCCHLYKEATTLPWVEMNRDMTLYKYADIYLLLSSMTEDEIRGVFRRAKIFGMEQICAFTVLHTAELFDVENKNAVSLSENILAKDPEFIHTVVSPKDKKMLVYTEKSISERFFQTNRKELLKEVIRE